MHAFAATEKKDVAAKCARTWSAVGQLLTVSPCQSLSASQNSSICVDAEVKINGPNNVTTVNNFHRPKPFLKTCKTCWI